MEPTVDVPRSTEEAFDLTTREIHQWEIDRIHDAWRADRVRISRHAAEDAYYRDIEDDDIHRVIMDGHAASKDIDCSEGRKPGLNFEGFIPDGRKLRVKVGWIEDYVVAMVHPIGAQRTKRHK